MRYRKKPVEVEAMQYPGLREFAAAKRVIDWMNANDVKYAKQVAAGQLDVALVIPTLEGDMRVDPDDWIIKGIKGEFYPCKPDIFEATYEKVEPWDE